MSKNKMDIFEEIFLFLIDVPSIRWKLKKIIDSKDTVDFASLNVSLNKLELEIIRRKKEARDE